MGFLVFIDDELDCLYEVINKLQICFHPVYAPEGIFTANNVFELQATHKDITIIADKNLVSPICEIAKNGTLKDKHRLRKVAFFVTWTKYLNARVTCGLGLLENDTAGLSNMTGEENRMQFLHGVDKIPAIIWKEIAFGYCDEIPECFLFRGAPADFSDYSLTDDFLLLSNEAAVVKIVELIRTPNLLPIERFITFMNWYTDHLDIAESIMVYAAMVFANVPNVSPPKKAHSMCFEQVQKGIKNQAWDITYITAWSMLYYNEGNDTCSMFATDDTTQKLIVVNIIPPGQGAEAVDAIFSTKAQGKKLKELAETKLGAARVRPFNGMEECEKIAVVKELLEREYENLRKMCHHDRP